MTSQSLKAKMSWKHYGCETVMKKELAQDSK